MGRFKNKKPRTGFSRPQSVMSSDVQREWKSVQVKDLQIDDIVAGMGVVVFCAETCDGEWYVQAGESTDDFFSPDKSVLAFVRKVD